MRILSGSVFAFLAAPLFGAGAYGQTSDNVLVVVNKKSAVSRRIGEYYCRKRGIASSRVCPIDTAPDETISRQNYEDEIERPIGRFLSKHALEEQILYIVTTLGVPLKISGTGDPSQTDAAAVDSELTELYSKLKGYKIQLAGPLINPFYRQRDEPFRHPNYPIYLVTRLAGYDFDDVKGEIDRALEARNTGKFVIDLRADNSTEGNGWLRAAATLLPPERVVVEQTGKVVYGETGVIGYASWGSNDPERKKRMLGFRWLPGAVMTEFVSTNGRTFSRPPDSWTLGTWQNPASWFAGAPQTMTADYLHEGVTGCSGHVNEPYLQFTPRPDYLLPAYYGGRNLAESYYLAIPALSWQNIVVGDPLCRIGKPER